MGDRANFGLKMNDKDTLYLYAHSGGYQMMGRLANAVEAARPRWNDPEYANRICLSYLIGESWDQTLGYGLSLNYVCDNEHSIPVVNFWNGTVTLYDRDGETARFTMPLDRFVEKYSKVLV